MSRKRCDLEEMRDGVDMSWLMTDGGAGGGPVAHVIGVKMMSHARPMHSSGLNNGKEVLRCFPNCRVRRVAVMLMFSSKRTK